MSCRHFLTLLDFTPDELDFVVRRAIELKERRSQGEIYEPLKGKSLGMVFELASTRTRVGFEVAMAELGGHAIFLSPSDTHLGRGEPVADTARVLSEMLHIVMIRTAKHETIECFAGHSSVPVINAMSDLVHPCQLLADVQTYVEHRGTIARRKVAFIGDGYNMCNSYVNAARQFDFDLTIATPREYAPDMGQIQCLAPRVRLVHDPREAVQGADLVVTDVWSSMGHEKERQHRRDCFKGFEVTLELLGLADRDALFMHCLPAHRGEEVSDEVMDDPR
ncbi:MAG: ornithine carbamoyltransferase, partial [Pseudomonadales bacterium]